MSTALLTDLYELKMAASYISRGMNEVGTFSLFIRDLPPGRSFLVAAGLEACLGWLEDFHFEGEDLEYLASIGFLDEALEAFSRLRFTGDVWAVPEGRIVFAGEPILEVSAPIAEGQLAETFLLNQVTFQTAIASKAARCRIASKDRVQLVEFGLRRTQGIEAGIDVARATAITGFSATSNVEAARRMGLVPAGTMAHSYIEAFSTELEAFRAFAQDVPDAATFLVDTYDTSVGVANAIEVIWESGLARRASVRIDSGDLGTLAREARRMLDHAGLPEVRIFLSGGLDESDVERLLADGTPFDAVGVGTRLGVSADAPYLDSAYKLVEYAGRPVMKLSTGKATLPGAKQVFRRPSMTDDLGLRTEATPRGAQTLLSRVMAGGRKVGPGLSLDEAREVFEADMSQLPEGLKDLKQTDERSRVVPGLTPALAELREQATLTAHRASGS